MGGGRGGQKRGRTQRKHFKQGRENVWKYSDKRTRPADSAADPSPDNPNPNPTTSWEPFTNQNLAFEEYYKEQRIVREEEWSEFLTLLRKPLPAAFRINSSGQFFEDIRLQLENDFVKSLEAEVNNEYEVEAIRPLPWYPENLAWHLNFSRMQLRKNQTLERFHEFLKQENEIGNITRQEAVSMVPPLFLDVLPDHHVLDMCAAPGSKTFQLLEIMHQSNKPGILPNGLVIANDVDVQRCNLLIHQTKRMCTANLIVTNHEAQHFPSTPITRGSLETFHIENLTDGLMSMPLSYEGQEELRKNILQFDRVLCDVPCSGDGTLRKAPDIWRKWNAGMGNGLHRLQVQIAMRGIALLKVGGRMVYSTCSMNPVEDEAVVAEVLRASGGSVELLDVSNELPELLRRPGLKKWKVRDKGIWLASYKDVPNYRRSGIVPSMFPCDQSYKRSQRLSDGTQEDIVTPDSGIAGENLASLRKGHQIDCSKDHESNGAPSENNVTLADIGKPASELEGIPNQSTYVEDLHNDTEEEFSSFPLERCMRIVPHDQNSGAFFIAVLHKLSPLQAVSESHIIRSSTRRRKVPENVVEKNLKDEHNSEISPSEDIAANNHHILAESTFDANLVDTQSSAKSMEVGLAFRSNDECCNDTEIEEADACDNGESGLVGAKEAKGRLQIQGKWKGVDPVLFFRDNATISSIRTFYGISESFPLDGHLVTRNSDANHVKRIYYISKSVHDILKLNFQVGQRLKIASVGVKIFERQTSKDDSSCSFRISSEGLPLLLPYISQQILCASLADFQHLLQYRTIKFADFVDADFGEKASKLMSGCCVVMLNEGNRSTDTFQVGIPTIAIVCWKGRTNLCIMVSQLDSQELLERLSIRYGSGGSTSVGENENASSEGDAMKNEMDVESKEDLEAAEQETANSVV